MSKASESLWECRNLIGPPITDPNYALALAMENVLSDYDYIVSQPSALGPEASRRFLEIMQQEPKPLTEPPLPWAGDEDDEWLIECPRCHHVLAECECPREDTDDDE